MGSRLRTLRNELKLTQEALASHLGIGKSALSMIETGKAALSERNKKILVHEFNVNPEWIDTGRGKIFNAPPQYRSFPYGGDNTVPLQSVPLYSLDNAGSLSGLFSDSGAIKPIDHIHIPNMARCDGALYLSGDAMAPLLRSGDIVMYKQLNDTTDIFWGDMYLLSIDMGGEEFTLVRYVSKSDKPGIVKLSAENRRYAEKEIENSRIRAIALIRATIHINSVG